MRKLNLSCGKDYKKGWINADIDPKCKKDITLDCNIIPYLYGSESLDLVLISNSLDYYNIPYPLVLAEVHRILKKTGRIEIIHPNRYNWKSRFRFMFGKQIIWPNLHVIIKGSNLQHLLEDLGFKTKWIESTRFKLLAKLWPDLFNNNIHIRGHKI